MNENTAPRNQNHLNCLDHDDRLRRTGTVWTAIVLIISVIGPGVLSSAWAIAQLGWIAGPTLMLLFAFLTYYTYSLLAECYRSGDPEIGNGNYTYMDAVRSNLGGAKAKICDLIQYNNLFGGAIGYIIASFKSINVIKRSNCFHANGKKNPCKISTITYMVLFVAAEFILSQILDFGQIWWLSMVPTVMFFTYSSIGLALGISKIAETGKLKGSLTGISIGMVTPTKKIWRTFQAVGNIASAYFYAIILVEIQDTVKSVPSESKTMKKASVISVVVTTIFYMLCGCVGYAAFGDLAPENLLTAFGYYNPYWLVGIANVANVVHFVVAYQVYCQPLFAFVERLIKEWFPDGEFIAKEIRNPIAGFEYCRLILFRLIWRTTFVIITTVLAMFMPFFNNVAGIFRAIGFWPLIGYFPVEMYIVQKRIPKWSGRWLRLQIPNVICFIISISAAIGSVARVFHDFKSYNPFKPTY